MDNSVAQWFIITAIGGKEDSIKDTLVEKIRNFGYSDHVKEIKIFKQERVKEEIFSKDDPTLPKSMKDTKTIKWVTLPDGRYKRIKTKIVNKFPGYIFINMIMDKDVWYAIRNTNGVMGFVGSSGKGALPIPISIDEFTAISMLDQAKPAQPEKTEAVSAPVTKPVFETDLKIGDTVKVTSGSFAGIVGEIKHIDLNKGTASVEIDLFGRSQAIDCPLSELKID